MGNVAPWATNKAAIVAAISFDAHGAMDCPDLAQEHAREAKDAAAIGRADATLTGISAHIEHNRVAQADPARRRRARRLSNGNAHAHRCAPPGRNAGGGPQGKSH
jgi:hypothetical protein